MDEKSCVGVRRIRRKCIYFLPAAFGGDFTLLESHAYANVSILYI